MYTVQQSVNFAETFIQYSPLQVGTGQEPALSISNEVQNTIMNPSLIWPWNRAEDSSLTTTPGTQDYTVNLTDFGFLEKVTLTDPDGTVHALPDVYNTLAIGKADSSVTKRARPNSACIVSVIYGTSIRLRFMGVPDKAYLVTITYQKLVNSFGPYAISSAALASPASLVLTQVTVSGATTVYTGTITGGGVNNFVGMTFVITGFANAGNNTTITVTANTVTTLTCTTTTQVNETHAGAAAGGQTAYTGLFTVGAFPVGSVATITGFVAHPGNNGSFIVVSVTPTILVLANPAGIAETIAATANSAGWAPIPDSFQDVFNNLFLGEALANVDDARANIYRQRGILTLLSKAEGLTDQQKNAFLLQFWARQGRQELSSTLSAQMGNQARGA